MVAMAALDRVIAVVALGYVWRVLVNVFYVAVVLYVFDALQRRPERITVAVLGLVYVTIRTIAIGQVSGLAGALKIIEADVIRIRELLHDEHAQTRWTAIRISQRSYRSRLFVLGRILCLNANTNVVDVLLGALYWGGTPTPQYNAPPARKIFPKTPQTKRRAASLAAALHWRPARLAPPRKGRSPNNLPIVVASTL